MPVLDREHDIFWEGFFLLSGRRTIGYSTLNPISLQDIQAYFEIKNITDLYLRNLFMRIIIAMDNSYLSYVRKKHNA